MTNTDGVIAVTEPSISGEHDLRRLLELSRRLEVPLGVVLNKADLSEAGREAIRATCQGEGLELLGEVPFDARMATTLARMAEGERPERLFGDGSSAGLRAAEHIWQRVEAWLGPRADE